VKQTPSTSSAFEIAGVLVVVQASLSLVAGLSALPFAIVEPGFRVLGVATIATAIGMYWLARNLRRGRRWAWRWLVSLEVLSLMMTLVLLPIGAMRGPVPLLVNVALPTSVLVLLASASGDRPAQPGPGPADPA